MDKCTAPGGIVLCESETSIVLPAETGGLTLRKLASFPQSAYLQPHLEELDKELQAIE